MHPVPMSAQRRTTYDHRWTLCRRHAIMNLSQNDDKRKNEKHRQAIFECTKVQCACRELERSDWKVAEKFFEFAFFSDYETDERTDTGSCDFNFWVLPTQHNGQLRVSSPKLISQLLNYANLFLSAETTNNRFCYSSSFFLRYFFSFRVFRLAYCSHVRKLTSSVSFLVRQ